MHDPGPSYVHGDPYRLCDRCGVRFRVSNTRKEWNGLITCFGPGTHNCWEPRHSQEFVRGVPDKQSFPDPRPEPTDRFITTPVRPEDL